ncbi:MAG: DUF3089 domain-containing protein [Solirubrobacterales bacterium]|nr:DUF3089 domain-containing protein [Solirubrobacterales bacterium]
MLRAVLFAAFALVLIAPSAGAEVRWLCTPAASADPCRGDLTTRVTAPDGSSRVERVEAARNPAVDCFYVYPTVSNQLATNATQVADPEVGSIATYQAQRFSTRCRIWAPLYRQVSVVGVLASSQSRDVAAYDVALGDVREAFRQFLRETDGRRGFVLLGHSQGSRMLRALIRRDIDPDPALRKRLVSAIIPGANATTKDFSRVGACEEPGQTGCVVSYHTFNQPPPGNARFGRTDTDPVGRALDLPGGDVICTDVQKLSGADHMETLLPTAPFAPGFVSALLVQFYGGNPPTAEEPWLVPRDRYTAACAKSGGANVLRIEPDGPVKALTPSPDATWGVHLADVNLPLGNLLRIADAQISAFKLARRPVSVRIGARRTSRGRRQLTATVRGAPGQELRVTLYRDRKFLVRRTLSLDTRGVGRQRFRLSRAGSYQVKVREGARGPVVSSPAQRISLH